jgi:hypothetical protein
MLAEPSEDAAAQTRKRVAGEPNQRPARVAVRPRRASRPQKASWARRPRSPAPLARGGHAEHQAASRRFRPHTACSTGQSRREPPERLRVDGGFETDPTETQPARPETSPQHRTRGPSFPTNPTPPDPLPGRCRWPHISRSNPNTEPTQANPKVPPVTRLVGRATSPARRNPRPLHTETRLTYDKPHATGRAKQREVARTTAPGHTKYPRKPLSGM